MPEFTKSDFSLSAVIAGTPALYMLAKDLAFDTLLFVAIEFLLVFLVSVMIIGKVRIWHFHHPYVPYVGESARVICPECSRRGLLHEYAIEMFTGGAYERWDRDGEYAREFKRTHICSCSNGHTWTYNPILRRNELPKRARTQTYSKDPVAVAEKIRAMRAVFHATFIEPNLASTEATDSEDLNQTTPSLSDETDSGPGHCIPEQPEVTTSQKDQP